MTEIQLRLIKSDRNGAEQHHQARPSVSLTPAEAEEAAYFKALIEARAARQAMLHRIMAELAELDELSPAA